MKKNIVDKAAYGQLYGSLLSKGKDVLRTYRSLIDDYNLPFTMEWYRQHAANNKLLERWYADKLRQMIEDTGTTDLTDEGRMAIEGSRSVFSQQYAEVENLIRKIRATLDDDRYNWSDAGGVLTFDEKSLQECARKENSFEIDEKAAGEYYTIMAELKAVQAKMLAFEQVHNIATVADGRTSVSYWPREFSGYVGMTFGLTSLMAAEFDETKFEEVFAPEFKK